MRLQMHATDPDRLAQRLGSEASEGCIRIPATLNVFLDRHGVLDAEYEEALAAGDNLWVIRKKDRELLPWPGRYMVIVDSLTAERPAWSPDPAIALAKPKAKPDANLDAKPKVEGRAVPYRPVPSQAVKTPSVGAPVRLSSQPL
jgi:hypothetical protein